MFMFKCQNGWTKDKMIKRIKERNNGNRSVSLSSSLCLYKSSDGNHCAIGCFIPENNNAMSFKGCVSELLANSSDLEKEMPLCVEGLMNMQLIHDRCTKDDVREALTLWINKNVEDT